MTRGSWWPWPAAGAALAMGVAGVVLTLLSGEHADSWLTLVLAIAAVGISVALGLLIAARRRGQGMAAALLANGLALATVGLADSYATYAVLAEPGALPAAEWAVLANEATWPLLFAPVVAIVLLFPDGRLPGPRWRPVAAGVTTTVVLALLLTALQDEPFAAPFERVDNPLPAVSVIAWLWPLVMLGGIASLAAAVAAVVLRFRRASGLERLQLTWLVYSSLLIPVTLLICLGFALAGVPIDDDDTFAALVMLMLAAVPAAVGIAILRYRLYEIDRLINRTLVYGLLTMLLAATYGFAALLLGTALGSGSAWATAGATLLVAVAFRPLRARVQDAVDRRFSRARYDGRRRIAAFLDELRAGNAAPEQIEPLLRDVLGDPRLELRFWLPASEMYVDAHGHTRAEGDPPRPRTPVTRAGAPLGLVLHDEERPALLDEAVAAAGLAIEIVRLQVELRRQLEEVEASRARIVAAGYAERRRLERDLHDGAQQRLVSIGLALRHAQHELGPEANGAGGLLDGAVAELGRAIDELRELAHGVRPVQLDGGLASAFRELAARAAPLRVEVDACGRRFPADVEAAAYFVASEALTNAIKHAGASHVTLQAQATDGGLRLTVRDDGVGGATTAAPGSGLRGLTDRVAAHGGSLRLDSAAGHGTTIVAELPCAS